MRKRLLTLGVIVCGAFMLTGCGKDSTVNNNDGDVKNLTYTNKFECKRNEKYTTSQMYYKTKQEVLNDADSGKDAVNVTLTRSYDFNKDGSKLLAYYDITVYDFLVSYDMNALKKYYEDECSKQDKNTYKSCNVSLNDKTITIITEVDLNSETANEYLTTATLESIKDNYAESPYKCE